MVSLYGTDIIEKGMKKKWTFQFLKTALDFAVSYIGIIDNEYIQTADFNKNYSNLTGSNCGGYALATANRLLYNNGSQKAYAYMGGHEFEVGTLLTMELDMTCTSSKHAILAYFINDDETVLEKNIAWNDIDIDRKYRLCVALYRSQSQIALIHTT